MPELNCTALLVVVGDNLFHKNIIKKISSSFGRDFLLNWLRITSPRYKQFGTKLSPIFGFAKSSKYKPIFPLSLIPKLLVACVIASFFSCYFFRHKCWDSKPFLNRQF